LFADISVTVGPIAARFGPSERRLRELNFSNYKSIRATHCFGDIIDDRSLFRCLHVINGASGKCKCIGKDVGLEILIKIYI